MYNALSLCVSLALKMGWKPLCPNSPGSSKGKQKNGKGGKDDDAAPPPPIQPAPQAEHLWTPSDTKGTGTSHKNQQIGQWSPESMRKALVEFDFYEERRVRLGLKRLESISLEAYRLKVVYLFEYLNLDLYSPPLLSGWRNPRLK